MGDDYYKGLQTLTPTDGIKDPQVRAFCDSLANAWQLRNGNTGSDDKQRFITKEEWDFLAKNPNIRAIAGIGQAGSTPQEPGPGDSGGGIGVPPPWIQNLVDFLNAGITLIDFTNVYRTTNELFANYYALTSEFRNEITNLTTIIGGLQNDITQINTITKDSTSASAQTLWALKETVNDPVTGLPAATAAIIEINNVSVTSTSANARQTAGLIAQVFDPATGNLAAMAAIAEINNVSATSTSANARHTFGLEAAVYDPNTGLARATADIVQLNYVNVNSTSANARTVAGMSAQVADNFAMIAAINDVKADSSSASARQLSGVIALSGFKARVFAQTSAPVSNASYTLVLGDLWIDTDDNNIMYIWNGSAWIDASDKRISSSGAGVTNEALARTTSDSALATALNTVWGYVGNANALVQGSSSISVNPNHGAATNFLQVQAAVTDPNTGVVYVAAGKQQFDALVSRTDGTAASTYSLITEASVGGVRAIAGFTLTAQVSPNNPNQPPRSAAVFVVDDFMVLGQGIAAAQAPFSISGGVVRMNIAYIRDRIQSDIFFPPGQGGYPSGQGWRVQSNGNAEFYGMTTLNRLVSGSVLVDRNSGKELSTTATGMWWLRGLFNNGKTVSTSAQVRFNGPNYHTNTELYHRIRASNIAGINLATTVMWSGVADHWIAIWYRYKGGPWQALNSTEETQSDEGAITCCWNGSFPMDLDGYYEFGFSPTDLDGVTVADANKLQTRNFALSVTMSNM